jgi:hypothetical protein
MIVLVVTFGVLQRENPDWQKPVGFFSWVGPIDSQRLARNCLAGMGVRRERYPKQLLDILPRHREVRGRLLVLLDRIHQRT